MWYKNQENNTEKQPMDSPEFFKIIVQKLNMAVDVLFIR